MTKIIVALGLVLGLCGVAKADAPEGFWYEINGVAHEAASDTGRVAGPRGYVCEYSLKDSDGEPMIEVRCVRGRDEWVIGAVCEADSDTPSNMSEGMTLGGVAITAACAL